jgi:large subunit ribosomal protein L22
MKCTAFLKSINMSHYKLNRVASLYRGLTVKEADLQLMFSIKKGAYEIRKLVLSCAANAENNHGIDPNSLFVENIEVGKAFVLRRFMACGRGRSSRIEKRFSSIKVTLSPRFDIVDKKKKIN